MRRVSSEEVVEEVVEEVASHSRRDPLDLPVLYDAIDPDALEQLLESTDGDVTVEFSYAGHTVVANSRSGVDVRED